MQCSNYLMGNRPVDYFKAVQSFALTHPKGFKFRWLTLVCAKKPKPHIHHTLYTCVYWYSTYKPLFGNCLIVISGCGLVISGGPISFDPERQVFNWSFLAKTLKTFCLKFDDFRWMPLRPWHRPHLLIGLWSTTWFMTLWASQSQMAKYQSEPLCWIPGSGGSVLWEWG